MRNKDTDQLRGNREADQRLCFRYIASTIPQLFKPLAMFSDCTARFVSDLVKTSGDWFSHNETQMCVDQVLVPYRHPLVKKCNDL